MTEIAPRLVSIQTGKIAALGPNRVRSAFVKELRDGPINVGPLGLDGDEQADLSVHGGLEKAVYAYPEKHYAKWAEAYPIHGELFRAGGVGENLTLSILDETTVCIGDVLRIGEAQLQVSQPRQPCSKFALRFGDKALPKAMVKNGFSGWYYRVLTPGVIKAGDAVTLEERKNTDWTIARLNQVLASKTPARTDLAELADLEGLASGWREGARQALEAAKAKVFNP